MSWQLYAYWLDRRADSGVNEAQVADLELGRGGGDLPGVLGLKAFDPSPRSLLEAGTKVPRSKVESALWEYCGKYLAGEDVLWELHFLTTILRKWKRSEKSILFLMQ
jgi:hypothetical protein